MRLYRLAAAQNHGPAMNNLGDAYENGTGVARDYVESANWYRRAAERGVGLAELRSGLLFIGTVLA